MLALCVIHIITPRPTLQSYTMHAERGRPPVVSVTLRLGEVTVPSLKEYVLPSVQPHYMHVRISMSELNEREDRSMIMHVRDEYTRRVLFISDIIFSRHYLESFVLFLWRVL